MDNLFSEFFFLKEGIIIFSTIINVITFYKINSNFKYKYLIFLLISLAIIFFFRYYLVYVLIFFYLAYFIFKYINLNLKTKDYLFLFSIFITILLFSFLINFRDIQNILTIENINIFGPFKYLASPLFVNIMINEDSILRLFCSLIYNIFFLIFLFSILKYDFKDKLINYLLFFIGVVLVANFFSPDEILTGGRHRGFIFWSMAVIVSLKFKYEKKRKKNIISSK